MQWSCAAARGSRAACVRAWRCRWHAACAGGARRLQPPTVTPPVASGAQPRGATRCLRIDRRPAARPVPRAGRRPQRRGAGAPARGGVARAAGGLPRARLSRRAGRQAARRTISWVWDVFDAERAARAAHHRRGNRARHAAATPGPSPTTPCCSRIAQHQHGPARRLPDLVRRGARHARQPAALAAAGAARTPRFLARSRRHFPHFPGQADPVPDAEAAKPRRGAHAPSRCRCRAAGRPVAAAISVRDTLTLAVARAAEPLTSIHPAKSFGTTIWARIASPSPPCYDHAAGSAGERRAEDSGWRARTERSSSSPATRIPRWPRRSPTISRPR